MYLHQIGAHRVALFLTIVTIMCETSCANMQYKTVDADMHTRKYRFGVRSKRAMERFDLQKYDEKSKRLEGFDHSKKDDMMPHGIPQKRQLSALQLGQFALPIVKEAVIGAVKAKESSIQEETREIGSKLLGHGLSGLGGLGGLSGLNGLGGLGGLNGLGGLHRLSGLSGLSGLNGLNGLGGLSGLFGHNNVIPHMFSPIRQLPVRAMQSFGNLFNQPASILQSTTTK